jgi:hypothetical protein
VEALDVPAQDGRHADRTDEAVQVELDAGLVAVGVRVDDAGRLGLLAQDRPDRSVELGVHQDHVLAVVDRGRDGAGAVLDRAGHLDQRVDAGLAGQEQRIVRDCVTVRGDRRLELVRRRDLDDIVRARLPEGLVGLVERPVRDRDEPHPGHRAQDLERDAAPHEPGADHRDPDRPALAPAALECGVDDLHQPSKSGQAASFGDTKAFAGSGHSIPKAGSSQRTPPSASGV